MEDENRKLEGSAKDLDAASLKDDKIAELNGQITELKRELEAASKKLRKAEFERDSAQRSVENLKTEVRDLGKKLQEERKKTLEGRNKSNDPLQAESTTQGCHLFACFLVIDIHICVYLFFADEVLVSHCDDTLALKYSYFSNNGVTPNVDCIVSTTYCKSSSANNNTDN